MPRLSLAFGGIAFIAVLCLRLFSYFEGLSFDKYWSGLLVVLLIFGSLLAYIVTAILTMIATIRGKVRWTWLLSILLVPVVGVGSYALPIPSFTDGMHDAVRNKVRAERLQRFAEAARLQPNSSDADASPDPRVGLMKRDFPEIYGLSVIEPRVDTGKDYVEIFWGSALVQHWGIRIGSRPFLDAPAEYQKEVSYRMVYDAIWVYHDCY
jgi:hypothetical protein